MNTTKGYIFLEPQHPILEGLVKDKFAAYNDPNNKGAKSLEPMDMKISDFDGVFYQVVVDKARPSIMQFNLFMKVLQEIKPSLDSLYGGIKAAKPSNNSDLTLELDASKLTSDAQIDEAASLISLIKRNVLASPLNEAFDALMNGNAATLKPSAFSVREHEQMVVQPASDRVNVAFSIEFADQTDAAVADIFLQEFVGAGRSQSNAPNVKYQRELPTELRSVNGVKSFKSNVGWLMFTVTKSHVDPGKRDKVVTLLLSVRSYLHYHIKASKAHLHTRMRAKVHDFLLVLNRARPEPETTVKKNYRVF